MKKVLFTIQWYPSMFSANALCDQKIIDLLAEDDEYDITCLVYRPKGAQAVEQIGKVKVIRFIKGRWWNTLIEAKKGEKKYSRIILKLNRLRLRISQILTAPIYPYVEPLACRKFAKEAVRLQKKENFDIVVSEYHGLDSLHAGSVLKKRYPDIQYVAILWDAFTGKEPAKYLPASFANRRMEKAESWELQNADHIIVMESSRPYHMQHSTCKSYFDRFHFFDIPGIVKPKESTIAPRFIRPDKINIVYAGILSLPDRDPEYIINALALTDIVRDLNLIFLCTGAGKEKLGNLKKTFPGTITISGFVDREELAAIYQNADVLLNFGGPNPNMVPSKVFEYLSYGKPIISTYYIDNEASLKYLEKFPLAICIDQRLSIVSNSNKMNTEIHSLLGKFILFKTIQDLYSNNIPDIYKELIDKL